MIPTCKDLGCNAGSHNDLRVKFAEGQIEAHVGRGIVDSDGFPTGQRITCRSCSFNDAQVAVIETGRWVHSPCIYAYCWQCVDHYEMVVVTEETVEAEIARRLLASLEEAA